MKKMMICLTILIGLLCLLSFVSGCKDSTTKPEILEGEPEPGVITMVTTADEVQLRAFGKGEMHVSIEWENETPDSVVTEWVVSLTEYGKVFPIPSFQFPISFAEGIITIKGYITHFDCRENKLTHLDVNGMPSLLELKTVGNSLTVLDVSGIPSLLNLNIAANYLTVLDLSKNTSLERLDCSYNLLRNLDLTYNTVLESLRCQSNQLVRLNISNNKNLNYLSCIWNQLTSLDVSNNPNLEILICWSNPLGNLDLSNNTLLEALWADGIQLKHIDLSFNTKLGLLSVGGNQLENLDLSNNTKLMFLWLDRNNFKMLDLSNNPMVSRLAIEYNQLDTDALNDIFNTLPKIIHRSRGLNDDGDIRIWGNPGEEECDTSIAEAKGWKFQHKVTRYTEHDIDEFIEKYINNIWRNQ